MKEQEKKVFVFCNIIHKGLMKMNHTYKQVIAPPEWPLNEVISFEEGVNETPSSLRKVSSNV